jgi:S-adenosylmethionine:tRNA ribosyltransferase-isomerase
LTADRPRRASDFDYDLPAELIAQRPVDRRGESRLLVIDRAEGRRGVPVEGPAPTVRLSDKRFADIVSLIPARDLVVLNTTRVRHARFRGIRPSGRPAEVLLIHPSADGAWVALGKPGSALRPGKRIEIGPDFFIETVSVLEDGNRLVKFVGTTAEEAIARYGRLPLPPYITRDPDQSDEDRYQTVYADREGSVAAPTAGLHFTPAILDALRRKGVRLGVLDLEVGPGTFKPVEADDLRDHRMHEERYNIPLDLVEAIEEVKRAGGAVWAVGTTVVRALESAAEGPGRVRPGPGETRLFITPGYRFRIVDHLITNFHLPRSTLLMLVSAFAGANAVAAAYRHAVERRYRFYSYGDAMAIL